jgi:hypothetical protein
MFVDLKPLGVTPDSQKIAIKMARGQEGMEAGEDSGFTEIISALLAATPEQLQNSLGKMEWVKVHGDGAGYAPVIDLSAVEEKGSAMMQMLSAEIGQQMDGLDSGVGKGGIEIAPNTPLPGAASDAPEKGLSQIALPPAELESDDLMPSQINRDPKAAPGGGEIGKSAAPDRLNIAGPTIPAAGSDGENFKPADLQAKMPPHPSGELPLKRVPNPRDPLPTATLPEEMINKEARNSEPLISRMSALPNQAATNAMGEQPGGQQSTDQNGNGHHAWQFMKKETGRHLATEASGQSFKPAHLEGSAQLSADPQELLTGNRAESSADLQPAATRMKMVPGQSVELVSGHHDSASQTSDPQSNIIRQIVQRMTLQTQGAQSTMTVKLKPEFLGNVHMQISTDNQQVVVRMATESLAVKEMVEQGLQHLKTELQNHGLEINKFDVFVAGDKEDSRPGQDLAGFRQALKERRKATPESSSVAGGSRENSAAAKQAEHGPGQGSSNEINYFV